MHYIPVSRNYKDRSVEIEGLSQHAVREDGHGSLLPAAAPTV